jgi:hypothetical protein
MSDTNAGNINGSFRRGRGRGFFRNRGKGQQNERRDRPDPIPEEPKTPPPICPSCGKPVHEMNSAIAEKESGLPAHFDCIITRLVEQEKPAPNERIVYLGAGSFALVEVGPNPNMTKFVIKKRIQYEEKEKKLDWRKALSGKSQV